MADRQTQRRNLARLGGVIIAALLIFGFVSFVRVMMSGKTAKSQRQVQIVQVIRPPPPPPPPDQPPPPPPEKVEEQLPKDQPEQKPDEEPPPAAPLGIDADGSAGGDEFGLAARRGGSDLVGGNGNAAFAWYTSRLKDAVLEKLSADSHIGKKRFSLSVRVWIEANGRISQVKLVSTTGDTQLDQRIEAALSSLSRMSDAPPLEMPQPVSLKIISRS
ncbi:MAG TPA: TonB C-terminal domain-containing protein [Steroidobacteraceae bacterium]|jgi:protein TonB|nr:TonB C-terminal domain-containing protein [Steroidobacteraceae bacterium]